LESSLGCKVTDSEIKPFVSEALTSKDGKQGQINSSSGTHGEMQGTFKFQCAKAVASTLRFGVRSQFASVRTLKVQVLSGDNQSGATIKDDTGTVKL